jgi:RHS repeat-associated protein
MRSAIAADLDREQSLEAMWHALRASDYARRNQVEIDAGVVPALMNARYYDPSRGQFISQDPMFWSSRQNLANPQSLNSYSYAEGNPITRKDPDGQLTDGQKATLTSLTNQLQAVSAQISALQAVQASGGSVSAGKVNNIRSQIDYAGYRYQQITSGQATAFGGMAMSTPAFTYAGNTSYDIPNNVAFMGMGAVDPELLGVSTAGVVGRQAITQAIIHGNSLEYDGMNYGYKLIDKETGQVLKYGETTSPRTRYTDTFLRKNGICCQVEVYGSKTDVHAWQHDMILQYISENGTRPAMNRSNW